MEVERGSEFYSSRAGTPCQRELWIVGSQKPRKTDKKVIILALREA